MLLRLLFFVIISAVFDFAISQPDGNLNTPAVQGISPGVPDETKRQSLLGSSTYFDDGLQKRTYKLYPEWFTKKIKKLVGNRFTHSYFAAPSGHHTNRRDNIAPKAYRRSFYGLPSNVAQHGGFNPFATPDDVAENNGPSQSLPAGAQLIDLPNNFQELSPQAFHELSMHGAGKYLEMFVFCFVIKRYQEVS